MANAITVLRIVLSPFLLLFRPFSVSFDVLYVLCGLTDIADGYIARKMHTQSAFGAKLDSIADIVFAAVCMIRLLPAAALKPWVWGFIAVILLVRLVNLACGFVLQKKLCLLHTAANRLTGLMLFLLPLTARFADISIAAIPVCVTALFASVQEGHLIRTGNAAGKEQSATIERQGSK